MTALKSSEIFGSWLRKCDSKLTRNYKIALFVINCPAHHHASCLTPLG